MRRSRFARICALVALFIGTYALAQTALLSGSTATGAGSWFALPKGVKTFQANARSTAGTGTAVVTAQCTVDGVNSFTIGTATFVTGTTTVSTYGFTTDDSCRLVRGNVTTITGTGTTASLYVNP
jgi:hypothetical protein